jgi:hypothetical protein
MMNSRLPAPSPVAIAVIAGCLLVVCVASSNANRTSGCILSADNMSAVTGRACSGCNQVPNGDCQLPDGCNACHEENGGEPPVCSSPERIYTGNARSYYEIPGVSNNTKADPGPDIECYNWHACGGSVQEDMRCVAGACGDALGWSCRKCLQAQATGVSGTKIDWQCIGCGS